MDHTFFPGYRKTLLSPEEILLSIEIPYSREVRSRSPGSAQITHAAGLQTWRPEPALGPTLASLDFDTDVFLSELCL